MLIELGCEYQEIAIDKSGINPFKDLRTILDFYCQFKKHNIDAVLNFTPKNNIYATLAAKYSNVKVINNIAGLGTAFNTGGVLNIIVRFLYKYSQNKADFIFFQNKDDHSIFMQLGLSHIDSDILPGSGVDLERFSFTLPRSDQVTRFALIARMLIDKGVLQYVECAEILKEKYQESVEFLLVGFLDDTNSRSVSSTDMDKWVKAGHVKYLGVSNNIEEIVGDVDCVVLPSFYREGVPKSLLEAAAMGKPLITTENVGCRETVEDSVTGFLCKPRSVSDLCSKLEIIINMPLEKRIEMGKAGRCRIEQLFDEKIVIDKYLNVLKKILA